MNYEPIDENEDVVIEYLTSRKLELTTENLIEGFNVCKQHLTLGDKIAAHNGTTRTSP